MAAAMLKKKAAAKPSQNYLAQAPKPQPPPPPAPAADDVKWSSVDPRTSQVVQYDALSSQALEAAYNANQPEVILSLGGSRFVVKLSDMRQYNNSGGSRKVIRMSSQPVVTSLQPVPVDDRLKEFALLAVAQADAAVAALEKDEGQLETKVRSSDFGDSTALVRVFDAILAQFTDARYQAKYGFSEDDDANLLRIRLGDPVPSYFANVSEGQSIYHRKVLSILGLRNLIKYGPEIFLEMKAKLFSGYTADYAAGTGPHKMKTFTGNVVDLDTCVLRCHEPATLANINMMQRAHGAAEFRSAEALANSEVGKRIAVSQAKTVIDDFAERLKLSHQQRRQRRIDLDEKDLNLPVATSNDDRGKTAVWIYKNVGVLTFHANVPTMSDVYGALLLAPYHLAKAYILCLQQGQRSADELQRQLDDFFENGVSDSCFNAKWKSIEMFVKEREKAGSIEDVLNEIQKKHQAKFLALDDDDDGHMELALMQQLAAGAMGMDPATRRTRAITSSDVVAWHKKIMSAAM